MWNQTLQKINGGGNASHRNRGETSQIIWMHHPFTSTPWLLWEDVWRPGETTEHFVSFNQRWIISHEKIVQQSLSAVVMIKGMQWSKKTGWSQLAKIVGIRVCNRTFPKWPLWTYCSMCSPVWWPVRVSDRLLNLQVLWGVGGVRCDSSRMQSDVQVWLRFPTAKSWISTYLARYLISFIHLINSDWVTPFDLTYYLIDAAFSLFNFYILIMIK